MLRVVLIDHVDARARRVRQAIGRLGHQLVAVLEQTDTMTSQVTPLAPSLVLAAVNTQRGDTIDDARSFLAACPCPIILYAGARDAHTITRAVEAGVGAYLTAEIDSIDLASIIELAGARFRYFQSMHAALQSARTELEQNKQVAKAKALLMKHHQLSEDDAHKALQQVAMNQRIGVAQAACNVVAMLSSLPAPATRS